MARTLKNVKTAKKSYPTRRKAGDLTAMLALAARAQQEMAEGGLLGIGAVPIVSRNEAFEELWKDTLSHDPINHSDSNNWRPAAKVRPSSFPFCARRYVFQELGLVMPSDFKVESCYYTEIGKSIHYVVQNALARSGRLWGLWKCVNPDCPNPNPKKIVKKKPSFLPPSCPHCDLSKLEYEELRLEDKAIGLKGHTDGILLYMKGKTLRGSILEIKSIGQEKLEKLKSASIEEIQLMFQTEAPFYGYWHQALTYAVLAPLCFPQLPELTEVEYVICSRDSPKMVAFTLTVDKEWYREIRARIVMAQEAKQMSILPVGFARNQADLTIMPSCTYCAYKEVCLRPEGKLKFAADALKHEESRKALDEVLEEERRTWDPSSVVTS